MGDRRDVAALLAALSADNDAMRIGATAAMSDLLHRPAQPDDVGRGHEVAFGSALRALAYAIRRGTLAVPSSGENYDGDGRSGDA